MRIQVTDATRRKAMAWMLSLAGHRRGDIARGLGVSPGRVTEMVNQYTRDLERRAGGVIGWGDEPSREVQRERIAAQISAARPASGRAERG